MNEVTIYESILLKKRGWVTNWPKKAVFIYSGGMDSTCTIAKIIEEKKVEIYPLFIDRGQTNVEFERQSAKYFESFFIDKYKNQFHCLKEIKIDVPPEEIKKELKTYSFKYGYPLRNTLMQMVGVQYAVSLLNRNIQINSVFCAQVFDDPFPHSTLAALRATTVAVCQNLGEWGWQITSPNIDPFIETDLFSKKEMIQWASKRGFPIEKTRSCYTSNKVHCGVCLSCLRRQSAFKEANVKDKTKYLERKI